MVLSCTFFVSYGIGYTYANDAPTQIYYTVTLLVDGEEYEIKDNQCSNYEPVLLPVLTKSGYMFSHWIDQDGKKYIDNLGLGLRVKKI